jgi:hypothetical protein
MWQGFRHGSHYRDHIKILSTRLQEVSGGAYTVYKFKNEEHWSLSFEMRVTGDMLTTGDGVLINIGSSSIPDYSPNLASAEFQMAEEKFSEGIQPVF